jgi:molybdopterin-guanine dinucleotide biosynthesis protein A
MVGVLSPTPGRPHRQYTLRLPRQQCTPAFTASGTEWGAGTMEQWDEPGPGSNALNLSIAVLAGGQSRRMGRDKALLDFLGAPLLQRVLGRVRPLTDDLFIVATGRPEYGRFGVRVVPDRLPGAGALGGIYTAVAEASHERCLVLACDLPFVNPQLLRFMAEQPPDYDVLIPALAAERSDQGGQETLETLHAIYVRSCLPAMERQLQAGWFKVIGFFPDVRVRRLPEEVVRRYDPELLSFFNANTPEAYTWALERARSELPGPLAS